MEPSTELFQTAVEPLLSWFRANRRDLPWRHERTFYTCLVSELMLQQTRVEAVREKYLTFLRRFPDISALAHASEDEVLKAWEGLGYYTRARNLLKAAKLIEEKGTPQTFEEVLSLPGVGEYTAGAICSVALHLPTPAVDGNVVRVLSRLFADEKSGDGGEKKRYAALLSRCFPPETGDFTEALMELGALVCLPNAAPLCSNCPWERFCLAHEKKQEESFPVRKEKRERRKETLDVFVLKCGDHYALRRRGEGLLAGMWEFPNRLSGNAPENFLQTKRATHIFTHVEWRMTGYLVETEEKDPRFVWATAEEIEKHYAVPSAFSAFFEWLS